MKKENRTARLPAARPRCPLVISRGVPGSDPGQLFCPDMWAPPGKSRNQAQPSPSGSCSGAPWHHRAPPCRETLALFHCRLTSRGLHTITTLFRACTLFARIIQEMCSISAPESFTIVQIFFRRRQMKLFPPPFQAHNPHGMSQNLPQALIAVETLFRENESSHCQRVASSQNRPVGKRRIGTSGKKRGP